MESLRQQVLQAELKRIEQEAEAHSYAIMNRADQLAGAYALCARINEGLKLYEQFTPHVLYRHDHTCEILIHTHGRGDVFLRRCTDLGLSLQESEEPRFDADIAPMTIVDVPGVTVFITQAFLATEAA